MMIERKVAINYIKDLEQTMHSDKAIATKVLPLQIFIKQKNIIKISIKNPERYAQEQRDRAIMILVLTHNKKISKLFSDIFLLCLITRITFNILYQRTIFSIHQKSRFPLGTIFFFISS